MVYQERVRVRTDLALDCVEERPPHLCCVRRSASKKKSLTNIIRTLILACTVCCSS